MKLLKKLNYSLLALSIAFLSAGCAKKANIQNSKSPATNNHSARTDKNTQAPQKQSPKNTTKSIVSNLGDQSSDFYFSGSGAYFQQGVYEGKEALLIASGEKSSDNWCNLPPTHDYGENDVIMNELYKEYGVGIVLPYIIIGEDFSANLSVPDIVIDYNEGKKNPFEGLHFVLMSSDDEYASVTFQGQMKKGGWEKKGNKIYAVGNGMKDDMTDNFPSMTKDTGFTLMLVLVSSSGGSLAVVDEVKIQSSNLIVNLENVEEGMLDKNKNHFLDVCE